MFKLVSDRVYGNAMVTEIEDKMFDESFMAQVATETIKQDMKANNLTDAVYMVDTKDGKNFRSRNIAIGTKYAGVAVDDFFEHWVDVLKVTNGKKDDECKRVTISRMGTPEFDKAERVGAMKEYSPNVTFEQIVKLSDAITVKSDWMNFYCNFYKKGAEGEELDKVIEAFVADQAEKKVIFEEYRAKMVEMQG